jgi:hypothetical protein
MSQSKCAKRAIQSQLRGPPPRLKPYRGEGGVAGPDVSTNESRPNLVQDPSFLDDEWILEQDLKPRRQVNLCMSVYF